MNAASTGFSGREAVPPNSGVTIVQVAQPKSKHGVPALLSFFLPGLGQLVKGQVVKAIAVWVGLGIAGVMCFFLIGFPLLFVVWVWNIVDAYNS